MLKNLCSDIEYNGHPQWAGIRSTELKACAIDPSKYQAMYQPSSVQRVLMPAEKVSAALQFGTMVHERVLLGRKWKVCPHSDRRTKAYKDWVEKYKSFDGPIITKKEQAKAIGVCRALFRELRREYGDWKDGALAELAIKWTDEDTNLAMKAKADLYLANGHLIDIKTTRSFDRLQWVVKDYDYPLSFAHYIEGLNSQGLEVRDARWLFVENEYPFRCTFKSMPEWMYKTAYSRLTHCYRTIRKGLDTGVWPESDQEFEIQPTWEAIKDEQDEYTATGGVDRESGDWDGT